MENNLTLDFNEINNQTNELFNNINQNLQIINNFINNRINCQRCNKKMNRKVMGFQICSYCINELKKIDAENKRLQKQLEKEKKKLEKQQEYEKYLLQYNDDIKVYNLTGEIKTCNDCKETKNFKEFYAIKDNKSKEGRYYLNGKCKECSSKTQIKKSKKVENIINNFLQNNN